MPAADAFAAWDLECAVEENAPLSTTGGHVWGAARTVARFLALDAADAAARGEEWRYARKLGEGARVVELGAGCGWLAVTVAHNCEASRVVATERKPGLFRCGLSVAVMNLALKIDPHQRRIHVVIATIHRADLATLKLHCAGRHVKERLAGRALREVTVGGHGAVVGSSGTDSVGTRRQTWRESEQLGATRHRHPKRRGARQVFVHAGRPMWKGTRAAAGGRTAPRATM
mgnify:CR=1 FL=1